MGRSFVFTGSKWETDPIGVTSFSYEGSTWIVGENYTTVALAITAAGDAGEVALPEVYLVDVGVNVRWYAKDRYAPEPRSFVASRIEHLRPVEHGLNRDRLGAVSA